MNERNLLQVKVCLNRSNFQLSVDLALPASGISVLFGPSGSGKTSVLRCVAGLERAPGRISLGSQVWQDDAQGIFLPTWARHVGYVFQEASLFEHMTVSGNLRYGLRRVGKSNGDDALAAAIDLLGIGHLLSRSPQSLSGGERQRVAIARALATQPRLLLLDEPLASLDLARRQEILPWLEQLHQELQIPMLYVTHTMEELTRLADHVVLLRDGSVQIEGPVSQVLCTPSFAASVGGEAGAMLQGAVAGHDQRFHLSRVDVAGGELWVTSHNLPIGSSVRLHIHANDVSLSTSESQESSIQNRLRGEIVAISEDVHPAQRLVRVRLAGPAGQLEPGDQEILARVTQRALAGLGLAEGHPVWCGIKSVALVGGTS